METKNSASNMYDLQYDVSVEVNLKQYNAIRANFSGIVPHREENGKFFIKLWMKRYKNQIENCLELNK